MDNTLFYKLPKDILIELLHKVYGNLDGFHMEDIYRLEKTCKERIEQDKKEKGIILFTKYKIDDNLVMYYTTNHGIILEDSKINIPKSIHNDKRYVFEISVHDHLYQFSLSRNINNSLVHVNPFQFKTLEELTPYLIQQMSPYNQNIIDECLRIINLILETRSYLRIKKLRPYV